MIKQGTNLRKDAVLSKPTIPITVKNCRKSCTQYPTGKVWIPAFAGMTERGNRQSITKICITFSTLNFKILDF